MLRHRNAAKKGLFTHCANSVMDFAGNVYLDRLYDQILESQLNSRATQERVFSEIKESLRGTAIYKDLELERIRTYRDYVKNIPVHDYDFFKPYVDRIVSGEPNVLYRGKTEYLLVTSGTSGFNSKIIPCNAQMIEVMHRCQRKIMATVHKGSPSVSVSAGKFFYGTKPLLEHVNGIPKGYVSGVLSTNAPSLLKHSMYPSEASLSIDDWSEKTRAISREICGADIRAVAGVPSYLINIFKDILANLHINTLTEVWPNLEVCLYSGTGIANYKSILDSIAGRKLAYYGAYLSTEAPLGFDFLLADVQQGCVFNLDSMLFSFQDVEDPAGAPLCIDELKKDGQYLINIGTPNGILQYAMKDYVKVLNTAPVLNFQVQGRYGSAINIAAEKVSHTEITEAVARVQQKLNLKIEHFFVYPSEDLPGSPRYEWVFALEKVDPALAESLSKCIDESLMEVSLDYHEARLDNGFISPPHVQLISADVTRRYFENFSQRGQLKMKTAFETKREFSSFFEKIVAW